MRLNELKGAPGARKKRKIVGRGPGSGHGKTAAKGHKGQLARAGGGKGPGFEGGQMPLQRRMIKRGFTNIFRKEYQIVNLDLIDKHFKKGEVVSPETMMKKGLINKGGEVKVLCRGELQSPLVIRANKFSRNAVARIEQAGGTAEVI